MVNMNNIMEITHSPH